MAITVIDHNPAYEGLLDLKGDIVFASPEGKPLALHLIKPQWASGGEGFPLVVFIQGSAWTKPDQYWEIPQLCRLAERGFVVATVTHRSCFESPAPAFLCDVKTAIRFLRAHAKEYDIDKTRVCAWGTSSGGNTALMIGLTGDDPAFEGEEWPGESTRVQAVVDCFGPTDLLKMTDTQYHVSPETPGWEENVFGGLSSGGAWREKLAAISPANRVKPGMALPPFLILHGDADDVVLYEDSEAFCHQLNEAGYEADLVRVTGAPHEGSFWSRQLLEIIFDFIEAKLK